jgi:lysophospholipase L1-like esterase
MLDKSRALILSRVAILGLAATTALGFLATPALAQNGNQGWVTAWGTSQQALGEARITDATVRMIARVTLGGDSVRIRLDNTFGTAPVTFGRAAIAPRIQGAAVAPGFNKPVTFSGKPAVTIPAGGSARSDSVALRVDAQQDLAVSLYVSGASVAPSQHNAAVVTSYLTGDRAGNLTLAEDAKPFTAKTTAMWWLKSIDVRTASPATAIVMFGDSITDGTCTTLDAHDRWEDIVAQRLAMATPVRRAVVNEGIGGNTVTGAHLQPAADSPPGMSRVERDVLSHSGVSHVVLFMGTNDIRREVGADEVIAGMKSILTSIKARGIKVIGVTIIPRHNRDAVPDNTGWNDAKTRTRNQVNQWIRANAGFDGVIDFDKVVRSRGNPNLIEPPYNCGDGIHPSPIGYFQMGKSVDLGLFLGAPAGK